MIRKFPGHDTEHPPGCITLSDYIAQVEASQLSENGDEDPEFRKWLDQFDERTWRELCKLGYAAMAEMGWNAAKGRKL